MDKINQIKKEIIISMKMMDTTIKNVKESEEYKIAQAYNQGLRDAMAIFEREMKRWFTRLESEEIIWVKQYLMRMIL